MIEQTPRSFDRMIALLGAGAIGASLWVALLRLGAIHEAAAMLPGTAETTGCEEESMFSIWRAARGVPVFVDPAQPPYASAYFNWLFYAIYGAVGHWSTDANLITVGRFLTATVALLAALWLGLGGRRSGRSTAVRFSSFAIGTFLFFGPLAGWWAFTLRPDIPALTAEVLGLVSFLALHHRRPLFATLIALGFFYCAWAFKPIVLGGPLAVGLFLLAHRCWRDATLLAFGSASLWVLTLALGGPAYRMVVLGTATNHTFYWGAGLLVLRHAALCLAPLLVFIPSLIIAWRRHRAWSHRSPAHDALHLWVVAFLPVTLLFAVAAGKLGAGPNYFFASAALLTVGVVVGLFQLESLRLTTALCLGLTLALQLGLLVGQWGKLTLRPNATELASRWQVFRSLPEPRFSDDLRLNLPWLNPRSPPLVMGFNYRLARTEGWPIPDGGVGGMVERGEFAALLLPQSTGERYDGGSLARYRREASADGFTVFLLARP